jgi:hypothetical protein
VHPGRVTVLRGRADWSRCRRGAGVVTGCGHGPLDHEVDYAS